MPTTDNQFTDHHGDTTAGNAIAERRVHEHEVVDPTLGNGDGTYNVVVSGVRNPRSVDNVLGVQWTGSQKVTVNGVAGDKVEVLFESATSTDSYTTESDGQLTGTLTVHVIE